MEKKRPVIGYLEGKLLNVEDDRILLLAGPVGYGPASYQLYHWDGKDVIPGRNQEAEDVGKVTPLGEIRPPEKSGAEGIVLLQEGDTAYELIVVFDGVKNGGAQRIRVAKKTSD